MPLPQRLFRPVGEAVLSFQGTGSSTAPGGAAGSFRPWPWRLGSGRRPERRGVTASRAELQVGGFRALGG